MRAIRLALLPLTAVLLAACAPEAKAPAELPPPDAAAIETHMSYLASDDLEGREAGTPGYDLAADYVAAEFEKIGLKPAGTDGTWFQPIEFLRSVRAEDGRTFEARDASGNLLPFAENISVAVAGSIQGAETSVEGQAVFVGFGVVAPDLGRDDFAGLNLNGKIAVVLAGTPKGIQSEERATYGSRKMRNISERGAIGVIQLETPTSKTVYPFQRILSSGILTSASLAWLKADGTPYSASPNIRAFAYVPVEGAAPLFASTPMSWDAVQEAAEAEGGAVQGFDLPVTIAMSQRSNIDSVYSANVAGMIEGTDPVLKNEVIVITAHLDHIGITPTIGDDNINNGALDNAAGVATMLDAARMLKNGPPLKRSVVFVALTAEEKGLLGAQYFAMNPSVSGTIVANVNLDMPILTHEFSDLIVYGAPRSTIAPYVEAAAAEMGVTLSPDPKPDQGYFTRSDHFRFVEAGIPSVYLEPGFANGGETAHAEHLANNYHRPSDDMTRPINFESGARFAELNARIMLALANADTRPLWKKDDFFARMFNGPQEP
ncbi:MAG TPA: M28 family metallopeptidase [Hyphomonas sp.]|nr:peptidase M20 [Hyphomonas sp.]HRJ01276.1 M28 family metallopeptidase [Hyphomonas sp.]